jgi:hypothetical protein
MTTRKITPDTTIYIIAGRDPQWISAADSPEKAAAEAIRGIGLSPDMAEPFDVYQAKASRLLPYQKGLKWLRDGMEKAEKIRGNLSYDHEKAVRLARKGEVEKHHAPPCEEGLLRLS